MTNRYAKQYAIEEENAQSEDSGSDRERENAARRASKKSVHFGESGGHIELKDLSEKDFINLIEGKN